MTSIRPHARQWPRLILASLLFAVAACPRRRPQIPAPSTPCSWKTRLAMSKPIVVISMVDGSFCSLHLTARAWHIDAVRGSSTASDCGRDDCALLARAAPLLEVRQPGYRCGGDQDRAAVAANGNGPLRALVPEPEVVARGPGRLITRRSQSHQTEPIPTVIANGSCGRPTRASGIYSCSIKAA